MIHFDRGEWSVKRCALRSVKVAILHCELRWIAGTSPAMTIPNYFARRYLSKNCFHFRVCRKLTSRRTCQAFIYDFPILCGEFKISILVLFYDQCSARQDLLAHWLDQCSARAKTSLSADISNSPQFTLFQALIKNDTNANARSTPIAAKKDYVPRTRTQRAFQISVLG